MQRFNLALSSLGRDANAGFNIRGLEGNRVLLTVDGIRIPRSLSGNLFGSAAFGRDHFDMGLISRVELVRGANSALYGSDGLGGMVAMFTTEPRDLLKKGQTFGGRVGQRYDQENQGVGLGATLVGQASDTVQWLTSVQTGRAKALDNQGTNTQEGPNRTAPNPQSDKDLSVLGKVVITPSVAQKHTLTMEHVDKHSSIASLGARGPSMGWRVNNLDGTTDMTRQRLSWDSRTKMNAIWADEVRAVLAYQQTTAHEWTQEDAVQLANPLISRQRIRDVTFAERLVQAVLQAKKTLPAGQHMSQRLVYGLDLTRTHLDNLMTGAVPPMGERFPLKRFPDTYENTAALFAQSEWTSNRWSVIPALRFDTYSIKPQASPLYTTPATSLSDSAWSPKLGLVFRPVDGVSVFGNLAAGFRAPSAHQVNSSFENLTAPAPYRTIPNAQLKPETSDTFELGARGSKAGIRWEAVAFSGRYKNFISDNPVRISGNGTQASPIVSQFVNLDNVQLTGFELKGRMPVGLSSSLHAAYGQTKGRDAINDQPLNSVNPSRLVLGADHRVGDWRLGATVQHVARKSANDINMRTMPNQYATPAYTLVDLRAMWQINSAMRLSAVLRNLTSEKYWDWTNVRGIGANNPALDAFTAPGRSLSVALTTQFLLHLQGKTMSQSTQWPEVRQACLALAARFQTLQLGTVTADGQPEASYAPFVSDQGFYYVYLSQLARHTGNLRLTGKAGVMFIQPESEASHVFARERLTLACEAFEHPRGSERFEQVIRLFDERFGKFMQVIRPLQDFGLFELRPVKGSYVAGFARAYTLEGADLSHVEHRRDEGHRRSDALTPVAAAQELAP